MNAKTGELVDNRLLVDELDYFYDTLYYQNTVKCDCKSYDYVMANSLVRGCMVSAGRDFVQYYPPITPPSEFFVDIATFEIEVRMAICQAMGIPSEYFRSVQP